MTVGELKQFISDLDDDMPVVVSDYNSGYGGLFEFDCPEIQKTRSRGDVGGYEQCPRGDEPCDVRVLRLK